MLDFGWVEDSVANDNPENKDGDGDSYHCGDKLGRHLVQSK